MKTNRLWIDTVATAAAIACAVGLLLAILATGTVAVTDQDEQDQASGFSSTPQADTQVDQRETYEGMLTCARCGAKHSAKLGKTASDCVRICVHSGSKFSLVDGEKVYQLNGDLNSMKRVAGQRAHVVGVLRGDTITVSSIAAAN